MKESKLQAVFYSKRKSFSKNRKYDRAFLESLKNALHAGGFTRVTFKLPHNLLLANEVDEISYEDFLNRERNYPSTIMVAINPITNEVIKVLFVNLSTKAFFKDNTFPSGHSEPPELYVQSTPDRLLPLFEFYYAYFFKLPNITAAISQIIIGFLGLAVFLIYLVAIFQGKGHLLHTYYHINKSFDFIAVSLSIIVMFRFLNQQTGLYVKEKEWRPAVWIKMALKGEFRDNPVVNLLVIILGGILVNIIWELMKKAL